MRKVENPLRISEAEANTEKKKPGPTSIVCQLEKSESETRCNKNHWQFSNH